MQVVRVEASKSPPTLAFVLEGALQTVRSLVFHVHPEPTGPSDGDLRVLELLNQSESMLYEIFGPGEGTIIRPK